MFSLSLYRNALLLYPASHREQFGEERIESLVRLFAGAAPAELTSELAQHLLAFCGRAAPEDDVSIVAIRKK